MGKTCQAVDVFDDPQNEQSTIYLEAVARYRGGQPIPGADISSIRLWLYVRDTDGQEAINSLSNTEIVNTARCVIEATSGLIVIELGPTDMIINNPLLGLEWHEALIKVTANGKVFYHRIQFPVQNLSKV